jgi:serine/threonine-protein kinase RsbW
VVPNDVYVQRYEVTGGWDDLRSAQDSLLGEIEQRDFGPASCFAIRLALEEALSNAVRHGNQNDPEKAVIMDVRIDPDSVRIDVRDEGLGFDPGAVPDPTEDENIEIPSGRGIVLMRSFMSDVVFHPPGNHVTMTYRRPQMTG